MAAAMTTWVILPPDWLIMKTVAIPAEIAIMATFMKRGPGILGILLNFGIKAYRRISYTDRV